ncbi:hypothetical protein CBOM_01095 [Ceraceosorus bombacis]|uniref:Uncharacterized protein n=1 Tax=Ceraceosorus bombacis TaxID=401625 RepID=A0A0P1BCR4_9BASI|nr:hypothetical protein CBOM_01095 [Ceraceosorus bombacis]
MDATSAKTIPERYYVVQRRDGCIVKSSRALVAGDLCCTTARGTNRVKKVERVRDREAYVVKTRGGQDKVYYAGEEVAFARQELLPMHRSVLSDRTAIGKEYQRQLEQQRLVEAQRQAQGHQHTGAGRQQREQTGADQQQQLEHLFDLQNLRLATSSPSGKLGNVPTFTDEPTASIQSRSASRRSSSMGQQKPQMQDESIASDPPSPTVWPAVPQLASAASLLPDRTRIAAAEPISLAPNSPDAMALMTLFVLLRQYYAARAENMQVDSARTTEKEAETETATEMATTAPQTSTGRAPQPLALPRTPAPRRSFQQSGLQQESPFDLASGSSIHSPTPSLHCGTKKSRMGLGSAAEVYRNPAVVFRSSSLAFATSKPDSAHRLRARSAASSLASASLTHLAFPLQDMARAEQWAKEHGPSGFRGHKPFLVLCTSDHVAHWAAVWFAAF